MISILAATYSNSFRDAPLIESLNSFVIKLKATFPGCLHAMPAKHWRNGLRGMSIADRCKLAKENLPKMNDCL